MKLFICNVIGPYQTGEILKKKKNNFPPIRAASSCPKERELEKKETLSSRSAILCERERGIVSTYCIVERE